MVDEMYLSHGKAKYPRYLLSIMDNGTVELDWYNNGIKVKLENPCLKRHKNGMMLEFGRHDSIGIRPSIEVVDYESGELSKQWERIK